MKACFGHTEGAAGIHGALLAVTAAQAAAAPPVMHARSLNPYVSAALSDWRARCRVAPVIPRVRSTFTM